MSSKITHRRSFQSSSASSDSAAVLPYAMADIGRGEIDESSGKRVRRRRKYGLGSPSLATIAGWISMTLLSMVLLALVLQAGYSILGHSLGRQGPSSKRKAVKSFAHGLHSPLPLSRFSSLSYALKHSQLVALYFAASWCPMSTPVSEALDRAFGHSDDILPAPSLRSTFNVGAAAQSNELKALAIVYVSSDENASDFNSYKRKYWNAIPFASPERDQVKLHFSTCSKPEEEKLNMDRKHEIPTIIIIDSQSHGILSTNGVADLQEMGAGALVHWKGLQTMVRETALEIAQNYPNEAA